VEVALVKGGLGELTVAIDGRQCYTSKRFLYPRPSRVDEKVRAPIGPILRSVRQWSVRWDS